MSIGRSTSRAFNTNPAQQLDRNIRTLPSDFGAAAAGRGQHAERGAGQEHVASAARRTLQLRAETFNAFDRVQFSAPVTAPTTSNFGQITSQANAPRSVQFAAALDVVTASVARMHAASALTNGSVAAVLWPSWRRRCRAGGPLVPSGGATNVDWPVYRGDPKGNQYSPLAQIHAANVHRLERAWEYKTGDANQRSTMHANPIVVNGVMYVTTPSLKAVALNAATGKEIWAFDPAKYNNGNVVRLRNRGVVYWKGSGGRAHLPLRARPRLRGGREDRRADHDVRARTASSICGRTSASIRRRR